MKMTRKTVWTLSLFVLLLLGGTAPLLADDVCGDFIVTGAEVCDNGSMCDDGFTDCSFDPSACSGIGTETCAPRSGDGCSGDCSAFEEGTGWYCFNFEVDFGGGPFITTFCQSLCGDGIPVGFEQCDDGNLTNGDGCDDGSGFCIPSACGNFVYAPDSVDPYTPEACDDGNGIDGDGCAADCTAIEPGWQCNNDFGFSVCNTVCGDGLFAGAEECEDGNGVNGDGCDDDVVDQNLGEVGNCTFTGCGNLVTTEGEGCDDGNTDDADYVLDFCDSNCTVPACGNGVVDYIDVDFETYIEPCDDGNPFNGDGCDNNCTFTACGNGVITGEEVCDDGNTAADDGCSSDCKPECGDGVKGPNEECDDGNVKSSDGCSSVCTVEGPVGVCGNGLLEASEECDDGNKESGDGCEADCTDLNFESANPTLVFGGLVAGDSVILNSPDPRDASSALSLETALVLPSTCSCTWAISPLALGHFSSATECQTQLNLDREGDGILEVETDCGAEGEGAFLQNLVVQPRPAPESGGCGLIPDAVENSSDR